MERRAFVAAVLGLASLAWGPRATPAAALRTVTLRVEGMV
jgi:hypothetical protein